MRQALIYPGFVLAASLLLSLFLPAYLLRGQLLDYAARGPLPWPTQVLVLIGDVVRNGTTWVVLGLVVFLLFRFSRRIQSAAGFRRVCHLILLENWLTRRFYEAQLEVILATTLSLQLEAGLPLLRALQSSLSACNSPLVDEQLPRILSQASQGDSLASVLKTTPGVGRRFCVMVAAGEECGHVSQVLVWVARMAKLEFDSALESLEKLLEPAVLVLLGLIVGFVTIASMLPTLSLLNDATS